MEKISTAHARENILKRLESANEGVDVVELPEVPVYVWQGIPLENFINNLLGFDGKVEKFSSRDDAITWMREKFSKEYSDSLVYSRVSEIPGSYFPKDADDVEEAFDLKCFVGEAEFGVGECGSVWMSDKSLGISVLGTLAENCFILLNKEKIYGSLCEAYKAINLRDFQYGVFFTGPSATADIEAVHITGAQGPLSFTVLIY